MRFEVGCSFEKLREYWSRSGYYGNLENLVNIVIKDSTQLIVWKDKDKIVGHSVWHESNTEEHREGHSRDGEDSEALRKLLDGKKNFVELHEWWLINEFRGKGYGNMFFDFFIFYMKSRGYVDLVFYADYPAALTVFRKRGCKEGGYLKGVKEYVFYYSLRQSPQDEMKKREQRE